MLDNVKNILSQPEIQMLFSENPDLYVKKRVQIRTQRPQIALKHICLFLSFLQTENLLHSVIGEMIGQASLINLMSMSPDKVAFLIFNVFIIASTSSALVGERKNESG